MKPSVLFVCTHNAARSQMAEAWLRHLAGGRYDAFSAGTAPAGVHPDAAAVMAEAGLDLSAHTSDHVDDVLAAHGPFDLVVTVCDNAREACPFVPARRARLHQSFPDPGGYTPEARRESFRAVREAVRAFVEATFVQSDPFQTT